MQIEFYCFFVTFKIKIDKPILYIAKNLEH